MVGIAFPTGLRFVVLSWIVVTTTGDRYVTTGRPTVKGNSAVFTLAKGGATVSIPARQIDWAASEKASTAPAPNPTSTPAAAPAPQESSLAAASREARATSGKEPRKVDFGAIAGGSVLRSVETKLRQQSPCAVSWDSDATTIEIELKNASGTKLSRLQVHVHLRYAFASSGSERPREITRMEVPNPPDLLPGQRATLRLRIPCNEPTSQPQIVDVTGIAEPIVRP